MTFGTPTQARLDEMRTRRDQLEATAKSFLLDARRAGKDTLSDSESQQFRDYQDQMGQLDTQMEDYAAEVQRANLGKYEHLGGGSNAMAYARQWSQQVTEKLSRAMGRDGETRAVVSGSIDIPSFIETEIIPIARPVRLIDLFPNRTALSGNAFEYFQQTVRDNKATVVPDNTLKPTSVLTVTPHQDRARVIAHISEPTPIRLWDDHSELQTWLTTEMVQGVLDGLEDQIIGGDGTGENMLGLLATPGLTQVPFTVDTLTTLRSAVTALQVLGEVPDGWALNPADAADVDLARWGTQGGWLGGGYESNAEVGGTSNIFGPAARRVVSNSVPAGTAILGDWTKLRVYVRQDASLAIDASGDLFVRNQFIARGEGRFGIGVLRPSAFAIVDLTAA